ncbi:MAG: NAD(P)H-dependent oxidoreductase subunit E, partial [Betaproteobacteria bacterium]|nr:NAD(P)H-dependent oxidoreductase subunit E [Betaproteobacteria bacterium]
YDVKPVGRCKICICTNVPCALMGATSAAAAFKKKLGIEFGETTADGKYTLVEGECFGACKECPVVIVDNVKMHAKITAERIDEFLADIDPDR